MNPGPAQELSLCLERNDLRAARRFSTLLKLTATESTNTALWNLLDSGYGDGTVIVADRQSGGRGRLGRSWASPAGNLYLSLLRRIREPLERAGIFSLLCGVAMCQAVEECCGLKPDLKWPNDLLVGGRKLAGILLEGRPPFQVVGVGLNVNIRPDQLPRELWESATSLLVETGRAQDREAIAALFLARLHTLEEAFVENPVVPQELFLAYFPFVGTLVTAHYRGRALTAHVRGVREDGALLLEGESGEIIGISAGEVTHVRAT